MTQYPEFLNMRYGCHTLTPKLIMCIQRAHIFSLHASVVCLRISFGKNTWGFPNLGVCFFGVPMLRIVAFGVYIGFPIFRETDAKPRPWCGCRTPTRMLRLSRRLAVRFGAISCVGGPGICLLVSYLGSILVGDIRSDHILLVG